MSRINCTILMRYELKGYRVIRRKERSDAVDGESIIVNILIGSTVIALILAVPTVTMLSTIYHVSNDAILAALASIILHYAILLFLVDWISRKISDVLLDVGEDDDRNYDDGGNRMRGRSVECCR